MEDEEGNELEIEGLALGPLFSAYGVVESEGLVFVFPSGVEDDVEPQVDQFELLVEISAAGSLMTICVQDTVFVDGNQVPMEVRVMWAKPSYRDTNACNGNVLANS
eukprot:scaffold3871_cov202-Prasinococcus_capsulatus_cf.AAC.1